MQGFLIVDKPPGITSHDVVRRVRRAAGLKRVGHAGTLDPLATGLLPVALGDATRLIEYFADREKGYRATLRLGSATDTQDCEGEELASGDWRQVDADRFEAALEPLRGEIEQVPPMYSALKKDGIPLYRLARQGVEIERPSRRVTIHTLEMTRFAPPEVDIDVVCSKGTYVRTLCHDIGEDLGCHAHMTALRRYRHGGFDLGMAVSLEQVEEAAQQQRLPELLLAPLDALDALPRYRIDGEPYQRLLNGVPPAIDAVEPVGQPAGEGELVCLLHAETLLAVARFEPQRNHEKRGDFRLQKVFLPSDAK